MHTIKSILFFCLLGTLVFAEQPEVKPLLDISAGELAKGETGSIKASLVHPDGRAEDITARVTWIVSPIDAVSIQDHTLTALKDGNVTLQAEYEGTLSDPVTLTVYWEVDGHRLPPEPDPKVNNATLLGMDVNHNGVRDDVERWIYETYDEYIPCEYVPVKETMDNGEVVEGYKEVCEDHPVPYHPVVRAVAMQGARAAQIIIQEPERARETTKLMDDALFCSFALRDFKNDSNYSLYKTTPLGEKFDAIQFNTVQRARAYAKYNYYLSGGVYEHPPHKEMLERCSDEVKALLKDLR